MNSLVYQVELGWNSFFTADNMLVYAFPGKVMQNCQANVPREATKDCSWLWVGSVGIGSSSEFWERRHD